MTNKVTRFDQKVDAISWAGLAVLWIVAAFLRFILHQDPEAVGSINFIGARPAAVCTVVFLLMTVIIRISPASIPSRIIRYLRLVLVVVVLVIYGSMCYSYATLVD